MKARILAALALLSAVGCDVPSEPHAADVNLKLIQGPILLGKIVYTLNGSEVWIMDANGDNARYVTSGYQGVLSPTGDVVAFVRRVNGTAQIFTKNLNDHHSGRQLTFGTMSDKSYPAWSPDGYQIVYNGYADSQLWVMNLRGNNQRLLYDASAAVAQIAAWSPDGTKIAFRDGGNIRIVNADGTGPVATPTLFHLGSWSHPSWSPDGSRIAMEGNQTGQKDIYTMNADGSGLVQITSDPGNDLQPSWGPNGIAYANGNDIFVWSLGSVIQITSGKAAEGDPDWR